MSSDIFGMIRTKYNVFSESQKSVADYILSNPESVMYSSLGDLAAKTNVSETTVLRFLRKLKYNSYQVFKVHMAQNLSSGTQKVLYDEVKEDDSVSDIIDKVIYSTIHSIEDSRQAIDAEKFEILLDKILASKKIFIIGVGSSSAVAFDLYHKFLKLDFNCNTSSDAHIMNIVCSGLSGDDLLICVSHSGESREILNAVNKAKDAGCPVCAITSFENSTLANVSDYCVISSSKETHFRSDALTSRIIQMTFIDMIYVTLGIKLGNKGLQNIERSREAVAINKR